MTIFEVASKSGIEMNSNLLNGFSLTPELLETLKPSPRDLAEQIYSRLNLDEITDLELLCFCSEVIGLLASGAHTYLLEEAKALNRKVYYFHYYRLWLSTQQTSAVKDVGSTILAKTILDPTSPS